VIEGPEAYKSNHSNNWLPGIVSSEINLMCSPFWHHWLICSNSLDKRTTLINETPMVVTEQPLEPSWRWTFVH